MTGRPLISLKGVRKSYGDYFELGPLELEVRAGCVVAVVGPNGSGKSTLFGMLMNLIQPDSGEVRLFGCSYPKDEVAIKQRVGYVPELSIGYDGMRVNDLAEFISYWYPKWNQKLYTETVAPLDIEPDTPFGHLSKGVQRRLSFALALATGAELLLLDEPTAGVDPLARKEMLEEDILRFMLVSPFEPTMERVRRAQGADFLRELLNLVVEGRLRNGCVAPFVGDMVNESARWRGW